MINTTYIIMDKIKYIVFLLLCFSFYVQVNAQTSIRILSINTRMSGQMVSYSVTPFKDYIKQYDPDFVMLQEVDYRTARNNGRDFSTELASELGYFSAFGYALQYVQGEYGVAILSKYPIEKIANTQLTGNATEMKEKRTVLYIDVIMPTTEKKVRMAVTHLDHSTDAVRLSMVQQLNAAIGTSVPTLLTGDFNAKPIESAISMGMVSWQRICNDNSTYPASSPSSKIDYIFAKPIDRWTVKSFRLLTNTSSITDHCALLADVELN